MSTRNFCIIAHIDHGKSTLADRLIEQTHAVAAHRMHAQLLDQMDIEQERGITIKLQPIMMKYDDVILNLIDTPGHVDFQYEVGRSLAAVEGAVLLVDATKGVQAQTLSTLYAALEQNLTLIPAVNKIDAAAAQTEAVCAELAKLLGVDEESVVRLSAKTGEGVPELLRRIVSDIPEPQIVPGNQTRLLVFDSLFDPYRGVIAYVRVVDGTVKAGQTVWALNSKESTSVLETGVFVPERKATDQLTAGDIGYLVTQFKNVRALRVGDTLADNPQAKALPGYRTVVPVVFASLFPIDRDQTNRLREALEKLALNDAAISYQPENNAALGSGFRCGFLGTLHLEIVQERLRRESALELIATTPTVAYQVKTSGTELTIANAGDWPDPAQITETKEPLAEVEIVAPTIYVGGIMELAHRHRGQHQKTTYLDHDHAVLTFTIPLAEIIVNFHDALKSLTEGYGSYNYVLAGYQTTPLVKIDVLLASEEVPPLARIVPAIQQESIGRQLVERLKTLLPAENFAVPIQATVGGKVIARETLAARRKDVTAKLYGGDVTRKRKLLEKQKKGKKRLAQFGRVSLPPQVFLDILKQE